MQKNFRHWRKEAEELNQSAVANQQPAPIPDAGTLRVRPLVRAVIQARLNQSCQGSEEDVQSD